MGVSGSMHIFFGDYDKNLTRIGATLREVLLRRFFVSEAEWNPFGVRQDELSTV